MKKLFLQLFLDCLHKWLSLDLTHRLKTDFLTIFSDSDRTIAVGTRDGPFIIADLFNENTIFILLKGNEMLNFCL